MGDMERRLVDAMNEHNRKETEQFMKLREDLSNQSRHTGKMEIPNHRWFLSS